MNVHVDEMVSEVTAEPGPAEAGANHPAKWEEKAATYEALTQIARDRLRTAAEGYDD
jgi:hypothetical protein